MTTNTTPEPDGKPDDTRDSAGCAAVPCCLNLDDYREWYALLKAMVGTWETSALLTKAMYEKAEDGAAALIAAMAHGRWVQCQELKQLMEIMEKFPKVRRPQSPDNDQVETPAP